MKTPVFITVLALLLFSNSSLKAQNHEHHLMQKDSVKKEMTEKMELKPMFTCPMHAEVVSYKPGDCPKCGMALVKKKMEMKPMFTCPMHAEVVNDKPGDCPKCGMTLVKKKMEMKSDKKEHHKHQ